MRGKNYVMGADKLLRQFDQLREIAIKKIIEDASARVRDEARQKVVVDTAELQNSIRYRVEDKENGNCRGIIFTNKEYASYVELGAGPVGEANHSGISPNVNPMYSPVGWTYYDKDLKRFIGTRGRPAKPFLYPALHDNRDKIKKFIKARLKQALKEAIK